MNYSMKYCQYHRTAHCGDQLITTNVAYNGHCDWTGFTACFHRRTCPVDQARPHDTTETGGCRLRMSVFYKQQCADDHRAISLAS